MGGSERRALPFPLCPSFPPFHRTHVGHVGGRQAGQRDGRGRRLPAAGRGRDGVVAQAWDRARERQRGREGGVMSDGMERWRWQRPSSLRRHSSLTHRTPGTAGGPPARPVRDRALAVARARAGLPPRPLPPRPPRPSRPRRACAAPRRARGVAGMGRARPRPPARFCAGRSCGGPCEGRRWPWWPPPPPPPPPPSWMAGAGGSGRRPRPAVVGRAAWRHRAGRVRPRRRSASAGRRPAGTRSPVPLTPPARVKPPHPLPRHQRGGRPGAAARRPVARAGC